MGGIQGHAAECQPLGAHQLDEPDKVDCGKYHGEEAEVSRSLLLATLVIVWLTWLFGVPIGLMP